MGHTSSTNELFRLDPQEEVTPDYEQPVATDDLIAALERRTRKLASGERVDADVQFDDVIGS